MEKYLIDSKNELYYEVALMINQEMYELGNIIFGVFKNAEDTLLKKVNCEKR